MQLIKYVARRGFRTSAVCKSGVETIEKTSTPSTFRPYPFSSKVRSEGLPTELVPNAIRPLSKKANKNPFQPASTEALRKGNGLMPYLRRTLPGPAAHQLLSTYFARRGKARLLTGSVLTVKLSQPPYTFSGVLITVSRKGPDSSILLRNIVRKTGVEMRVNLASPTLLGIKIIQRAGGMRKSAVTATKSRKSNTTGTGTASTRTLAAKQTGGTTSPSTDASTSTSASPAKSKKPSKVKQEPVPPVEVDEKDALMGKRMRRSRLYFLRDYPAKMSAISAGITKRDQ